MEMKQTAVRDLVLEIIAWVDYDLAKYYDPATSEDPEQASMDLEALVDFTSRRINRAKP